MHLCFLCPLSVLLCFSDLLFALFPYKHFSFLPLSGTLIVLGLYVFLKSSLQPFTVLCIQRSPAFQILSLSELPGSSCLFPFWPRIAASLVSEGLQHSVSATEPENGEEQGHKIPEPGKSQSRCGLTPLSPLHSQCMKTGHMLICMGTDCDSKFPWFDNRKNFLRAALVEFLATLGSCGHFHQYVAKLVFLGRVENSLPNRPGKTREGYLISFTCCI